MLNNRREHAQRVWNESCDAIGAMLAFSDAETVAAAFPKPDTEYKSIEDPVDWAQFSFGHAKIARETRQKVLALLPPHHDENLGFALRGVAQAMADAYDERYLERGMQSTMRGIRNAFAERFAFLRTSKQRSASAVLETITALLDAGVIKVPDGMTLKVSVDPVEKSDG